MPKNKISEYSATPSNNTDIGGINISEGCAPSGINNAIRELMAQLKDQQAGTDGDGFAVTGAFTSSGGAVFSSGTTFSGSVVMSSTVSMNGNNNIGNTTSATILSGSVTQTSGSVLFLDAAATTSAAPPLSWSGDTNTGIYRPAADTLALVTGGTDRLKIDSSGNVNVGGNVILGTGDATTSVSGSILRAPSGAGTNIAGSNLEIQAGNGTGTGGSGTIALKTAAAGSSGSTANTLTQRLLITKNGGFSFGSGATDYGSTGQVLKSNGDAPPSFGSTITTGTAVSASGTSVDFTSIPSWVRRITVIFSGVSTSGTSPVQIQLGTGSTPTYTTSGYTGLSSVVANGSTGASTKTSGLVADFGGGNLAAAVREGLATFCTLNGTTWVGNSSLGLSNSAFQAISSTSIALGAALTAIRITTVNGTDTFDAGSINIFYE
jgi:hypothetical protein